jgi:hypothetical protein
LESSSFYRYVACYHPWRQSSAPALPALDAVELISEHRPTQHYSKA